jgi:hypothetical protein
MEARLASLKSVRLPWDPTEYNQQVIEMPGQSNFDASHNRRLSQFILSMPKFANNHLEEEIVPDYEPA